MHSKSIDLTNNLKPIMYKTLIVCFFYLCLYPLYVYGVDGLSSYTFDEALSELDEALVHRQVILDAKESKIDSLKSQLEKADDYEARLSVLTTLIDEYKHFDVDSLKVYYREAISLSSLHGDSVVARRLWLDEIGHMPVRGEIREAFLRIDSVDVNSLDEDEKMVFFEAARWAALCTTSLYSPHKVHRGYFSKYGEYNDSLMARTDVASPRYRLLAGSHYLTNGQISLAIAALNDYLENNKEYNRDRVNALSMLATAYFERSRKDLWMYYIILAAAVDARVGILDNDCLRQLSGALYQSGNVDRAYGYMSVAQEDVDRSSAYIRSVNVAPLYPRLISDYRDMQRRREMLLYFLIGSLFVIAALAGIIIYMRYNDVKRLKQLKTELVNANLVKDSHLGRILSLCSIYMEKLDDYNTLVGRKIAAGQIDDLYKLVKSGKFLDDQSKMFYEIFDNSFVHMFPTFIDEVNALLEPDKGLEQLSEPIKLTPELRILAFMRLGLDDSAQIARFLGLSLNTVYTYRNRMKSRAKNRATFENDIMNIGTYN